MRSFRKWFGVAVVASASGVSFGAENQAATEQLEEVMVTGTRVITNGNNSPTPVTVLNTEEFLKLQPTTVTEAINLLPALQGSQNVTSRPGGAQRNGAGAYMNLRNMGSLRTLVLYDGIRAVPTINQNGADVDSSVIPQLLLKRVDVVTGGVSAVYGSDAISGVINFITDREFTGIKTQASYGTSTYGDNKIADVGFAVGKKFGGDRGNFSFSYQYHEDPGITARQNTDREFFARVPGAGGNGTTVPYFNMLDMRISNTSFGGLITNVAANGTLADLVFTPNGTLTPFRHGLIPTAAGAVPFVNGTTVVPTNTESGGDGGYFASASLKAGINFQQAYGRVDYDLTDNVHAFAQVAYGSVHTFNNFRSPQIAARISFANPFLSSVQAPYSATLAANPNGSFAFSRLYLNDNHADQYTDTYMAYAGLEGAAGKYKWNFNVGNSQSVIDAINNVNIDNGRLFAAIDAVNSGGQIVCRAALTNANYSGCSPLNLLGDGRASQAALNYLFTKTYAVYTTELDSISGSITGAPFSSWAGPVNTALSAEWRRLSWDVKSNASPDERADCGGVQTNLPTTGATARNCIQGTTARWFFNTGGPLSKVTQTVAEVAGEFNLPLLANATFAQSLDFTGAVRFTDYSTSGNVSTWKAGLDWRINDSFKIRGTRSRDIRAPNLHDLYQPTQRNPTIQITDPVVNAQYIITNVQTGNTTLTPESANTLTAGFVLTPQALPDFSLSMDYYNIKVDDVIFLLQGFSNPVLQLCATTPSAPACAYIRRDAVTNRVVETRSLLLNIAKQDTWGIDTEASYKLNVRNRPLRLRAMASYQPKLDYDQGPLTGGKLKVAGAFNAGTNRIFASPIWKLTGVVSYEATEQFSVSLLQRWRSSLDPNQDRALRFVDSKLPSIGYTTLNLSYARDTGFGNFDVFLNVANLFNKFPTVYYTGTQGFGDNQGLPEGDDPIGRYYTLGLRWKL